MNQSFLFDTELPKPIDLPGYPAVWSPCKRYRYVLWRCWTDNPKPRYAMWTGVNPSKANEEDNDNTVGRMVSFSQRWGYEALCVTNLNGFITPYPDEMKAAEDSVGDDNDYWIARIAIDASIRIACWGVDGKHLNRQRAVSLIVPDWHCLKTNKDGSPLHPLYAKGDLVPKPWKFDRTPVVSEEDGE